MPGSAEARLRRLLETRPARARALLFACGAALTLSFAPFGLWWLAPFLVLPVLLAGLLATPRAAAWLGFWFGAGLFLAGTHWLYVSVHVFGRVPLLLAILLMLALVVIMAAWFAACGGLLSACIAGRPARLLLAAPAVWVLIEWLRGWVLSGFPWLSLGYGQVDSPLAAWLPVVGVYGVSLLVVLSAAALLNALLSRRRAAGVLVLVALSPWVLGAALEPLAWTAPAGPPVRATIVQGGVSQDRKWQREQFQPTLALYRDALLAARDSDIVVWPEVAIPSVIDRVESYLDQLQSDLAPRQTLLLGILERRDERIHNSVLLLAGDDRDRQVYRKRHLVPFGEYFPVPDFIRNWMRLMSLPHSDLSPGAARQPLLVTAGGRRLAVAICYEDAYGAEQLYALPDADILVNVSNDAWFGDSIAPHQHLEIARVRAREAGRHVIRATNNGISAMIGPDGTLRETVPQFQFATLTLPVTPMQGLTPYAQSGNWPVLLLACLGIGGCLLWRRSEPS
ncbi:MAG: apolipoprotein N-acyltransferase [Woeseiaceae bacterium]|nr:apolipoprotein N-acyltransferase [Woeseiaceae bacterium]